MEFVCTLGTPEGRVIEEVHEARSEESARTELRRRGFHVFKVRRRGMLGNLSGLRPGGGTKKIKTETLLLFNQELAALIKAGLPILQSLEIMLERQRDAVFADVLSQVHTKVESGANLSDAFADFDELLPPIYAQTLKAGERSGELEQVLRRFVRYMKLVNDTRRKVVSALVYPIVLVVLSFVLMIVMGIYVIPKFADFFTSLEAELPLMTRISLSTGLFLQERWPILLLVIAAAGLALRQAGRMERGAVLIDRWKLRFPLLGKIFTRMALSEFSRSLSTLLAGGIPLVSALESSVTAVANAHIRKRMEPIIGEVREGGSLSKAVEQSGVAPDIVIEMTKVGEETGALDAMLSNASDFLDQEVEVAMQRVLSLIEPLLLVFMGAMVAFMLMSVYLPLFNALGQLPA